jgi:hypothetical protein
LSGAGEEKKLMPTICKIRFTNVIYEDGNKRYNDEIFSFHGHNGAILLENGGGKTVFIQTALQAVLPHTDLAERKIRNTLQLEEAPAHIAIEWILNEAPRRYALTCVSLFLTKNGLDSYRYVHEYGENDAHAIEHVPFTKETRGKIRPAERGEIQEYYQAMAQSQLNAKTFSTIRDYKAYIEETYHIIPKEWESIVKINSSEGGVENFFDECKTTNQLFDRLLIPAVEDAMIGYNAESFAETFEKHRSSFKQYKQLKEKIEENKRIQQALDTYVKQFESMHQHENMYLHTRQKAKAYMEQAVQEKKETEVQLHRLEKDLEILERERAQYKQKEALFEIAVEQQKLSELLEQYREHEGQYEELLANLFHCEKRYYSLRLAEYKQKYETAEGEMKVYEEELRHLDEQQDTTDLLDQLTQIRQELHGYFLERRNQFKEKEDGLRIQSVSLASQMETEEKALQEAIRLENNVSREIAVKQEAIIRNERSMDETEKEILANPEQETVEKRLPEWRERYSRLDNKNVALTQENKQLEADRQTAKQKIETLQKELREYVGQKNRLETQLNAFEEAQQRIKTRLSFAKPSWQHIESVYLKQETIQTQLREKLAALKKEREQLLVEERIAFRFADDYALQDVFYADSYLAQQIEAWKSQFSYLETGVRYVQAVLGTPSQAFEGNPLWPVTLVTTEKEKSKVVEKVARIARKLQYPVLVLTTDEASECIRGKQLFARYSWVEPAHWQENIEQQRFSEWKQHVQSQAQTARQTREVKERELEQWQELQNEWNRFLEEYPYDFYRELTSELLEIQEKIQNGEQQEYSLKQQIAETEKHITNNAKKITDYKDQMNHLENVMEKANKYIQIKRETERLQNELLLANEKQNNLQKKCEHLQNMIARLREERQAVEGEIRDIETEVRIQIDGHYLYRHVQDTTPRYTRKTIQQLEQEHKNIEFKIEKIAKGRHELEVSIERAEKEMKSAKEEIEKLRTEYLNLDESILFPSHGKEIMSKLWKKRTELKETVKHKKEETDQARNKVNHQQAKVNVLTENYHESYPQHPVTTFSERLETVKQTLAEEKRALTERKQYVDQMKRTVEVEWKNIETAITKLDKYDPKHQFMNRDIHSTSLSEHEITEFRYNRDKICAALIKELDQLYEQLSLEKRKVEAAKGKFQNFCRKEIRDVKLREMAIEGVERKEKYEEVVEFTRYMETRIHNAIKYAEESIISHDKDLEQFIVYIHAHVKKLADELKIIPKKTRVKIENQWKEIYAFTIPEWDEQEGKAKVRHHIEWILEQLEKEAYKDGVGQEDAGKIRKDLEMWLQSKQLLRIVMGENAMKVTCRKVTNNSTVTTRSYTWEQSNSWSGGEKWSKNMTLFLGILNYIAEKQQPLQQRMKRHRAVIMDNPFGKASSDHVLNPVFFIAEQLGFQIIALTAHAEGKFLRDYFPVIYSCRLRQAVNSDKQIVTKERTIHQAYFRDHDPIMLERLGEVEQLEFF